MSVATRPSPTHDLVAPSATPSGTRGSSAGDLRHALARALAGDDVPGFVKAPIGASWVRAIRSGLEPGQVHVPLNEDVDRDGMVVRAARPVLDELARDLGDARVGVVLGDPTGTLVDRRVGNRDLLRAMDRIQLAPGFVYAEHAVGTNGIGTALAAGPPSAVEGDEHFAEAFTAVACAGAPITDPRSGGISGVIDLTCLAREGSALMLPLAIRAARQIEQRLAEDRPAARPTAARRGPRFGWDSLTPTERRVTELVVQGLTNKEAAEQLFLSRHTVGFHLRSIYRKVAVNSRVELTRVALEQALRSESSESVQQGDLVPMR